LAVKSSEFEAWWNIENSNPGILSTRIRKQGVEWEKGFFCVREARLALAGFYNYLIKCIILWSIADIPPLLLICSSTPVKL
jgi:hypothetical protein